VGKSQQRKREVSFEGYDQLGNRKNKWKGIEWGSEAIPTGVANTKKKRPKVERTRWIRRRC